LLAMVSDARHRIIPNWLTIVMLLTGLAKGYYQSGLEGLGWHAAHMALALIIGMALFALRWLGGGDGKFYAASAAWFNVQSGFLLAGMISMAGLVLVFVWFTWRKLHGQPTFSLRSGKSAQLPFGIAIGLGTLATYALQF
ncbi:MAG: prepilin peptidase, partial [Sphingomonadales bacterium]|nr:prepilin peptidase [Sphingomonadales bacterium]